MRRVVVSNYYLTDISFFDLAIIVQKIWKVGFG